MSESKSLPPTGDRPSVVSISSWRQETLRTALKGIDDRRYATSVTSSVVNLGDYRISMRASAAYHAALGEFATIARQCRRHYGLSLEEVAERTGISSQRLQSMEEAEAAISWPEMLVLSPFYRIKLSEVCKRLKCAFERLAGVDAYEIEQQLQFRPESPSRMKLSSLDREGLMAKLLLSMDDSMLDSTIASWPSFLLPTLGDSIRGECVSILIQLQLINQCLERYGKQEDSASSKARSNPVYGSSDAHPDVSYVDVAGIATSLHWHLTRHFHEPRRHWLSTPRRQGDGPWRSIMEAAELELKRHQVVLREAVTLLVPFASCQGASESTLRDWSDTPFVFPGQFEPMHIEDALCQSALLLFQAARGLSEVAKCLP